MLLLHNTKSPDLWHVRISAEFYSAYLYHDFTNFYASKGLTGFAKRHEIQAKEEQDHAMSMYHYRYNNGEDITLGTIKPRYDFQKPSGSSQGRP